MEGNDHKSANGLSVLVVDDEANIRKTISLCLELEGCRVRTAESFNDAALRIKEEPFDVAFLDLRLGARNGLELIPLLQVHSPRAKIVIITAYASIDSAIEAMRNGASDYIPKPFTPAQIKLIVRRLGQVGELERQVEYLQTSLSESVPEIEMTTRSPLMRKVMAVAREAAASSATILLKGERGTGKSVMAKAIHDWSPRAGKPFLSVSCPSLSAELLESELFGHAKGSFTGALKDFPGRISLAQEGTLLLDEIGDMPLSIQPKLLRFIQERAYERIGENLTRSADVRIIAASNIDLGQAAAAGRFREDLYYRLNVVEIELPPLRDRREDIEPLAAGMLRFFGRANHKSFQGFTPEAAEAMVGYGWPGNLRELRNMIERVAIFCKSEHVGRQCLPEKIRSSEGSPQPDEAASLERIEEMHIRRVLASSPSLQKAAEALGIDQATLWRKRRKYKI